MICIAIILLIEVSFQQPLLPTITIVNTDIIPWNGNNNVISNGILNNIYNDTTLEESLNCKNGDLTIIDNTNGSQIIFSYTGLGNLNQFNSNISSTPNKQPQPNLFFPAPDIFILSFNCPTEIDDYNYYNKIEVIVDNQRFSFFLNCDPNHRHKLFQYGYLIITVMNAAILLGVSMHSRISSLKIKGKQIRINLRWFHSLIMCIFGTVLIAGLYFFAFKDFDSAFVTVRYVGIVISSIFVLICFNQFFYFIPKLRKPFYKQIRPLQLLSIFLSSVIIIMSIFFQNWILYNFMAICICVSCIKLFHFKSLKQAYIFLGITVFTVSTVAIISHYILARSYNDYATQLSSPLFLQVPDLVNNLYKQCSWLPVVDVIFPGSMIAYLRKYDQNRSSKLGGVYTVLGNITFICSTILWIGTEAIYPFSVPFSLVTYIFLMLVIFLFSWKRKEWATLYTGNFQIDNQDIDQGKLKENDQSFSDMINNGILDPLKRYKYSSLSNSEHQNQKQPQKS